MNIKSFISLYTPTLYIVGVCLFPSMFLYAEEYTWEYIDTEKIYGYHSVSIIRTHGDDVYIRLRENTFHANHILHKNMTGSRLITIPQYQYPFDSSVSINDMITDKRGALWAITHNRLLKFENNQWQVFFYDDSLANDCEYTFCRSDSSGNIWIGRITKYPLNDIKKTHIYHDLVRYDGTNFSLMRRGYGNNITKSSEEGEYVDITVTSDGSVWTFFNPAFFYDPNNNQRLLQYNNGTWTKHNNSSPPYSTFRRYARKIISYNGSILVVYDKQIDELTENWPSAVALYTIESKTWKLFSTKSPPFYKYVYFRDCSYSPEGNLWAASEMGFHLMLEDSVLKSFQPNSILQIPKEDFSRYYSLEGAYTIVADNNDMLWVGTNHGILLGRITTSAVEQHTKNEAPMYCYPNPAHNYVTIDSDQDISQIEVYDYLGNVEILNASAHNTFSIAHLDNGVYTIKTQNQNMYKTFSFVICH